MTWTDAFKFAAAVIVSLGGGGAIVVAIAGRLGDFWTKRALHKLEADHARAMQESQHRVDEALRRLDAALEHRNFLRQRLSEFELQGLADCWRAARRCVPLINAPRAINSGTDPEVLKHHTTALADGQNELLEAMNRHEPFLGEAIVELLDGIRQGCYGELLQIQHTEHFERDWWTRGAANQETVRKLTDQLKEAVRRRVAELRQLAD